MKAMKSTKGFLLVRIFRPKPLPYMPYMPYTVKNPEQHHVGHVGHVGS